MINVYSSKSHYARSKGIDRKTVDRRGLLIRVEKNGIKIGYIDALDLIKPLL